MIRVSGPVVLSLSYTIKLPEKLKKTLVPEQKIIGKENDFKISFTVA